MLKASPIREFDNGAVYEIGIQIEEGLKEAFTVRAERKADGTYEAIVRLETFHMIASGNPCITYVGALKDGIGKLQSYLRLKVLELVLLEVKERPKMAL